MSIPIEGVTFAQDELKCNTPSIDTGVSNKKFVDDSVKAVHDENRLFFNTEAAAIAFNYDTLDKPTEPKLVHIFQGGQNDRVMYFYFPGPVGTITGTSPVLKATTGTAVTGALIRFDAVKRTCSSAELTNFLSFSGSLPNNWTIEPQSDDDSLQLLWQSSKWPVLIKNIINNTVNANTARITNVVDPTGAQDAATKNYVDTSGSSATPATAAEINTGTSNTVFATPLGIQGSTIAKESTDVLFNTVKGSDSNWFGLGTGAVIPANIDSGGLAFLGLGTIGGGQWQFMSTNANGEGACFFQNGNTSGFSNPGDNDSFWFFDEDSPASANWKISVTGTISSVSDKNLKKDIVSLDKTHIYNEFKKIDFVKFKWKFTEKNKRMKEELAAAKEAGDTEKVKYLTECIKYNDRKELGIIAQQFTKDTDLDCVIYSQAGNDYRADYSNLFVYSCSAIQKAQEKIDALEVKLGNIKKPKTVPEAKAGSYFEGEIVNIVDYSTEYMSIGDFVCHHYTKKPIWAIETNNLMFEINGSEGLKWLIHSKITGQTKCVISFEEASKLGHLFNNSGVIAFDDGRKKLFSMIDNEIYSIQTKKETL